MLQLRPGAAKKKKNKDRCSYSNKHQVIFFHILFHYGFSQNSECSSLCLLFIHHICNSLPLLIPRCFTGGTFGKEPTCQGRRHKRWGFDPWVGKIPWKRVWQPTPVFLPGNAVDRGAWQATVHRVAESRTWLKRLSTQHNSKLPILPSLLATKVCSLIHECIFVS